MTTVAKPKVDKRFLADEGTQVFDGNELLVKGALETEGGVHLLTGYPGSPLATFFDVIREISPLIKELGIYAHQANNEALAAAMLNGSQMHGLRGLIAMKSVGLHVAADALALGNLVGANAEGGAIVVLGDDPWSESTQVPVDSRYLCEHLRMPVVEPADAQEIKDWIDLSFKLSRRANFYVGYMMTPLLADGGGTVTCRPNHHPLTNTRYKTELDTSTFKLEETVLLPPRTGRKEEGVGARNERLWVIARELGLDRIEHAPADGQPAPFAFVTAGEGYQYLRQAMQELGIWGQYPVLKLGLTYPINPAAIEAIAATTRNLVVVEERREFMENQISAMLMNWRQAGKAMPQLWGKHFPAGRAGFPNVRGLNVGLCIERLASLLDRNDLTEPAAQLSPAARAQFQAELNVLAETAQVEAKLALRTPTFCPGCPHRDSANVFLEIKRQFNDAAYMKKHHGCGPIDLVFHGDTGCYTMLMFPPNEPLMHNYSGMGLGAGTGAGIDPFIKNKQVVFMGDGTFFHSGMLAISNAIKAQQDITFVILDNRTTAMTGHQSHPGTEDNVLGEDSYRQSIEHVVRGLGAIPGEDNGMHLKIARLNPERRKDYKALLEETILTRGIKVVIADKECGITFHRRRRQQERAEIKHFGFLRRKTYMNITPEVCEMCLECTHQTGCPGLAITPTDHGPKMETDLTTCVNDGACARIDACPSFEELTVIRKRPPRTRGKEIKLENLPEPKFVHAPFAGAEARSQDSGEYFRTPKNRPADTPTAPIPHPQPPTAGSPPPRVWRAWLAGVGGMGIGLASAILVRAGWYAGYQVRFSDKKGLAIRNGGVFASIIFTPQNVGGNEAVANGDPASPAFPFVSQLVPYGKADVLVGVDILEAARAVDPKLTYRVASRERTAVVVNTGKTSTVLGLLGRPGGDFEVAETEALLRRVSLPGRFFAHNITEQCERLFGTKMYANIAALGAAYQMGLIPIHIKEIEHAIHDSVPSDHKNNLRAFNLGRKLVAHPEEFDRTVAGQAPPRPRTLAQVVREKALYLNLRKLGVETALKREQRYGKTKGRLPDTPLARQYKVLVVTTLRACRELDRQAKYDIAVRIYDLIQYDSLKLARQYCDLIRLVFHADDERQGFAITRSAIWNLAKLMILKDEIYVATLLTSYEKYRRDRQRYNVSAQNGDRIRYKRVFHPRYFGIKLSIPTPNWVLYVLRRLKFLRKLVPWWHKSDKTFRQWYAGLLERFYNQPPRTTADYQRWQAALAVVDEVNGYREFREPKIESARVRTEQILAGQATASRVDSAVGTTR